MDVEVNPQNVEACHWLKSNNSSEKAIIKLSKRQDADKIRAVKKKLKLLKFEWMGINNPTFINDSLCRYYESYGPNVKWSGWTNAFTVFGYYMDQ